MSWNASVTRIKAKDAESSMRSAYSATNRPDPDNLAMFEAAIVGLAAKVAAVQPNPEGLVDIWCNGHPVTVVNRDPPPPPPVTAL